MIIKRAFFYLSLLTLLLSTDSPAQNCDSLHDELNSLIASYSLDNAYTKNIQVLECYKTQSSWLKYGVCVSTMTFVATELDKHEILPDILSSIDTLLQHIEPQDSILDRVYIDLGILYHDMHDNDNAIKYIEKGLDVIEVNNSDPMSKTSAYATLGDIYQKKLDNEKAVDYYQQSLDIFADSLTAYQLYTKIITYINLATVYENGRDYKNAIKNAMMAIDAANNMQITDMHAVNEQKYLKTVSYCNMSSMYRKWNKPDSAIYYLDELQKSDFVDTNFATYYHRNMGIAYHKKKNYEKAAYYLNLSLDVTNREGKSPVRSTICKAMGKLYSEQGKYSEALEYFQQALIQLIPDFDDERIQNNPNVTEVYRAENLLDILQNKAETSYKYYQVSKDKADLNAALNTYQTTIEIVDKVRIEQQHDESVFSLLRTARPIYEGAIEAAYAANQPELVYKLMEKSKAVILLTALRDAGAKITTGIPDSLLNQEKDLKVKISYNKRRLNKAQASNNQEKIKEFNAILFEKREQLQKLINQLETDYPEYYERKYNTDVANLEELQNQLKQTNSTAIEFFMGEKVVYVSIINGENIRLHQLEKEADFEATLTDFLVVTSNPSSKISDFETYTQSAASLYQKLLQPILPSTQNILIIPDGKLTYLAFDALIQHPIKGEYKEPRYDTLSYLVNQFNINYDYSASVLLEKKPQKSTQKLKSFLGFAPGFSSDESTPSFSSEEFAHTRSGELDSLVHNQREVEAIKDIIGGIAYTSETATIQNFFDHANKYRIIHFATHAVADDTIQNTGHKIYLQDSVIRAEDIYNTSLNADLVVLSACETGQGELIEGEGVMSLARAFRYTGCPSLTASLWSVDDKSTADIMINFYKNLSIQQAQNQALTNSKRTYLQQLNTYEKAHPFYWAGFVHVGDTSAIARANNSLQWLWWVLGFVVLLGLWRWLR